jgi:poly-gamma-glutamate synthesis protein (capsule biosynthesis protein)
LLTTANNHALDAGRAGMKRTARVLREYGFYQTGTFLHERDRRRNHPLLVYVNGLEIAFLNYCYPAPALSSGGELVSTIDLEQIREDLRRAHRAQPHAIIALMHWGEEYSALPSPAQRKLAQQLFRWGVDAVIGTHPHVA